MEKPNLLWEIIRFFPEILFSLEPTSKTLRTSLCHDLSHLHFFLESEFGYTSVRDSDFTYCKSLLISELYDPGLLFRIKSNELEGDETKRQLISFDCKKEKVKTYDVNTPPGSDIANYGLQF